MGTTITNYDYNPDTKKFGVKRLHCNTGKNTYTNYTKDGKRVNDAQFKSKKKKEPKENIVNLNEIHLLT